MIQSVSVFHEPEDRKEKKERERECLCSQDHPRILSIPSIEFSHRVVLRIVRSLHFRMLYRVEQNIFMSCQQAKIKEPQRGREREKKTKDILLLNIASSTV